MSTITTQVPSFTKVPNINDSVNFESDVDTFLNEINDRYVAGNQQVAEINTVAGEMVALATNSANSASASLASANASANSATQASASASQALSSANASANSATQASASATNSATSATNSATSASASATSATNSANSASASEISRVASVVAQIASETAQGLAEDARDEATTQAGIATTKAYEVSTNTATVASYKTAVETTKAQVDTLYSQVLASAISKGFYPDTATGLANTTDGESFTVLDVTKEYFYLYDNNNGVADLLTTLYTKDYLDNTIQPQIDKARDHEALIDFSRVESYVKEDGTRWLKNDGKGADGEMLSGQMIDFTDGQKLDILSSYSGIVKSINFDIVFNSLKPYIILFKFSANTSIRLLQDTLSFRPYDGAYIDYECNEVITVDKHYRISINIFDTYISFYINGVFVNDVSGTSYNSLGNIYINSNLYNDFNISNITFLNKQLNNTDVALDYAQPELILGVATNTIQSPFSFDTNDILACFPLQEGTMGGGYVYDVKNVEANYLPPSYDLANDIFTVSFPSGTKTILHDDGNYVKFSGATTDDYRYFLTYKSSFYNIDNAPIKIKFEAKCSLGTAYNNAGNTFTTSWQSYEIITSSSSGAVGYFNWYAMNGEDLYIRNLTVDAYVYPIKNYDSTMWTNADNLPYGIQQTLLVKDDVNNFVTGIKYDDEIRVLTLNNQGVINIDSITEADSFTFVCAFLNERALVNNHSFLNILTFASGIFSFNGTSLNTAITEDLLYKHLSLSFNAETKMLKLIIDGTVLYNAKYSGAFTISNIGSATSVSYPQNEIYDIKIFNKELLAFEINDIRNRLKANAPTLSLV